MGKNFRESLREQMKNPEFKEEWENAEAEFQIMKAMLNSRKRQSMTQKQLSDITGIAQSDISKIENGNANPSIRTLKRIAYALDCELKLSFEPIQQGSAIGQVLPKVR